jgi:hypothetical protein
VASTARRVLGTLLQGLGDPLVVDPSALPLNPQRAILGVMARLGAGVSLDALKNELAGTVDEGVLHAEVIECMVADTVFSEGAFKALVVRLNRERAAATIRLGALEVVAKLDEGATPEGVAPLVNRLLEATRPEVGDEVEGIGDNVHELFLGNDKASVPTGLAGLADLKIVPGNLTVLAARPGYGKTALLGTVTLAAARGGWRVLFLSLEMPAKQIRQRLLAGFAGIPLHAVMNPQDTSMVPHLNDLAQLPIGIRDAVAGDTLTVERIAALVHAYRVKYPDERLAVVVDYLQLVRTRGNHERRHELLGHVCRELKATALREGVPMIVAAQVGRGVEQRGKEAKPQLSDLRESGEIENTADQVLLVHRDSMMDSRALIAVAKYRMGAPFVAEAYFDGEVCLFRDPVGVVRDDWQ